MNLLMLGGTGFIGAHQVGYALARGHRVTLFNVGLTVALVCHDVEHFSGDRNAGDYDALVGCAFDACVENPASYRAGCVLRQQHESTFRISVNNFIV